MADNTTMPDDLKPIGQQTATSQMPDDLKPVGSISQNMGSTPSAGHHVTDTAFGQAEPGMNLRGMGNALVSGVGGALEGAGEGVFSTLAGAKNLANKALGTNFNPTIDGHTLDELSGENEAKRPEEKFGYGGETLGEFLLGDEALKGLSQSDKLLQAAKTMKILEKSPKTMAALKIGAEALKSNPALKIGADALRSGAVQGAQTYVRTGGDTEQALHDAKTMAIVGGVGSAVGQAAGKFIKGAGEAGETVQNLSDRAENVPSKQDIADNLHNAVKDSKEDLHNRYEATVNDIKSKLSDADNVVKGGPISRKAEELIAEPVPAEHPAVSGAKDISRDKLDGKVVDLLTLLKNGGTLDSAAEEQAMSAEDKAFDRLAHEEAGTKPPTADEIKAKMKPLAPWNIDNLIEFRQAIRKAASDYQPGDVNARTLKAMLEPVDAEIDTLAQKVGDTDSLEKYKEMRDEYRQKIGLYDKPEIANVLNKGGDASKWSTKNIEDTFLKSKGAVDKINNLKTVLGDQEMNKFTNNVFSDLLKDSEVHNHFNPDNFMRKMEAYSPENLQAFFGDKGISDADFQTLMKDTKAATAYQKIARAMGLTAVGAGVGGHLGGGIGTMLGLIIGSGTGGHGGFAAGRDLLDWFANHPSLWKTYIEAGNAVKSPLASLTKSAAVGATGQALTGANQRVPSQQAKRNVYQGAAGLAGQ